MKERNPADSGELIPVFQDAVSRTGIVPKLLSVDDGYASDEGRNYILDLGFSVVSISGSKGKKLVGEDDPVQVGQRLAVIEDRLD